jgi:D-glycero-D-manno-heptose 1,7-bisphosphate phosphatase
LNGAVFLDRDGTLIANRHYLSDPTGVTVLPGVCAALARIRSKGLRLFLFTNQSGVGRGYFTMADVEAVNSRMIELIGLGDDLFTGICIAPERPDEPALYRKPSPRYIREVIAKHALVPSSSWMIGDSPSDWEAGINAGINAVAIVGTATTEEISNHRIALGIPCYGSLLEWVDDVIV